MSEKNIEARYVDNKFGLVLNMKFMKIVKLKIL